MSELGERAAGPVDGAPRRRDDPVPAAMVAIGAGWLLWERLRPPRPHEGAEPARDLAVRSREGAERARARATGAFARSPLAIGAAAVVVGVGLGLLLPPSDGEDRALGERRDRFLEGAIRVTAETAELALDAIRRERARATRARGASKHVEVSASER